MAEGEEAADSLKVMAEKHAVIRGNLDGAQRELNSKTKLLHIEEDKLRLKKSEVCFAEQTIRTLNEKAFFLRETLNQKEKYQKELLKEYVSLQENLSRLNEQVEEIKKVDRETSQKQEAHKSKIIALEQIHTNDKELATLQKEVDALMDLKTKLEAGDPGLKRIWTGEALQTVATQKQAILEAFAERDIETEMLRAELDDKVDQVKQAEQRIQIEEKQMQARMRLMQKQLQELEETEKHLRSTVQYMEQQVESRNKNM